VYVVIRGLKETEMASEIPIVLLSARSQAYEVAGGLQAGPVIHGFMESLSGFNRFLYSSGV